MIRRLTWLSLFFGAGCFLGLGVLLVYLGTHIVLDQPPVKSDIIVVLGGDTDRASVAALLYFEGWAGKVLISGFPEECADISRELDVLGVPRSDLLFDEKSTTTQTNGVNSSKIVTSLGMKRVILVTSWYHSARSARIFRKYLPPDVKLVSVPSRTPATWGTTEHEAVRSEVLKSLRNYWQFGIPLTN